MRYLLSIILTLIMLGCDSPMPSGPTPTPVPPPPVEEPVPEPPVDPGIAFSLDNTRGVLIFPGTQASESQVLGLVSEMRSYWPTKRLLLNVCSETGRWDEQQAPWPAGPEPMSDDNMENLDRFLRVTASSGAQVYLNIFCTVRDDKAWMNRHAERYTTMVAEAAQKFDHVLLSVANEPYHPNSWFHHNDARVRQVRDWARMAGFTGPMGTDDNLGCPDPNICSFKYAYRNLGFTPNFHPFRGPGPGSGVLRRLVEENGLPLIISEPTAYAPERDGERCCTGNKAEIEKYLRDTESVGAVFDYHTTCGLGWPAQCGSFSWIPR